MFFGYYIIKSSFCEYLFLFKFKTGGKKKPLKEAKKEKKELDEDDIELQKKLKEKQKALEDAKKIAAQKGPLSE